MEANFTEDGNETDFDNATIHIETWNETDSDNVTSLETDLNETGGFAEQNDTDPYIYFEFNETGGEDLLVEQNNTLHDDATLNDTARVLILPEPLDELSNQTSVNDPRKLVVPSEELPLDELNQTGFASEELEELQNQTDFSDTRDLVEPVSSEELALDELNNQTHFSDRGDASEELLLDELNQTDFGDSRALASASEEMLLDELNNTQDAFGIASEELLVDELNNTHTPNLVVPRGDAFGVASEELLLDELDNHTDVRDGFNDTLRLPTLPDESNSSSVSFKAGDTVTLNDTSGLMMGSEEMFEGASEEIFGLNETETVASNETDFAFPPKKQQLCFDVPAAPKKQTEVVCSSKASSPIPLPRAWMLMNNLNPDTDLCKTWKPAVGSKSIGCVNT
jgi:hypothetical protein